MRDGEQYPTIFDRRSRQEVWCIEDPADMDESSSLSECGTSFFSNVNSFFHIGGGGESGSPARNSREHYTEEPQQQHHHELTQPYDLRRDESHDNYNMDEGYAVDYGQQQHYQTRSQLHVQNQHDEEHLFPDEFRHAYELRRNRHSHDTLVPYEETGYVDDFPEQQHHGQVQRHHQSMLLYDKHQDYEKLNGSSHNTLTDESTVDEYYEDGNGQQYYNDQHHHHHGSNSSSSSSSASSSKKAAAGTKWYQRRWFMVLAIITVATVIGFVVGRRFGSNWKSSKDDFQSLNFGSDNDNDNNNSTTQGEGEDSSKDATFESADGNTNANNDNGAPSPPSSMPTAMTNNNNENDGASGNNILLTGSPTLQPTGKQPVSVRPTVTPTAFPSSPTVPVLIVLPTTKQPTSPSPTTPKPPSPAPTDVVVAPPLKLDVFPVQASGEYFSEIESGPMVGHTTHNSASIWAFYSASSPSTMQLAYAPSTDVSQTHIVEMPPRPDNNNAALATIHNLVPDTMYFYELRMDDDSTSAKDIPHVVARGHFKTAPPQPTGSTKTISPVKFEYLLTSCMNIEAHKGYPVQPVWDHVLEKQPDFAMLAGDTIYLTEQDWTSDTREVIYDRVWYRNMKQRSDPHFAQVLGTVPTYSAWDDHEYGSNNAEKNQPGKRNSLKAFKDVWANPGYGTGLVKGTFYSYYWGNVHFIVLDNRWYRDVNQKTQLGDDQKSWLYGQLKDSKGVFKVIVNGCDIMEAGYDQDVDDIGKIVSYYQIPGVIFNAGDIHRNEFKQMTNGNWPYPVTQFTSSGIARDNWMRPWSIIKVDTEISNPTITAHFYGADSTDLDTTWSNDPNLRCSSIQGVDRWKESRCTETISYSDLTPSGYQIPKEENIGSSSNVDFTNSDFTVGAYYYPWYGNADFNGRNYLRGELSPPQEPTLGEYDQRKEEVITQHLRWSQQANINMWATSWWGPQSSTDKNTLAILQNPTLAENNLKIALLYETKGRISSDGNVGNVYNDLSYAAENYFSSPHYLKIDERPVFFVYLARWLSQIGKLDDAVAEMRRAASDHGFKLYIVGDMAHSNPPSGDGNYAPFDWLDAITEYDVFGAMKRPMFAKESGVEYYRTKQQNWSDAAHVQKCDFIPSITPGYNDKGVRNAGYKGMSRKLDVNSESGSLFKALLKNAVQQVDESTGRMFMITSFNEWHEDTQIEPVGHEEANGDVASTFEPLGHTSGMEYEEYGTKYLDILRDGTKR